MAKFLIQSGQNTMEDEERFVLEKLNEQKYLHTYHQVPLAEVADIHEQGLYPIGTIDFVTSYLQNAYGIGKENPIEIPLYLRTEEFLKRNYSFLAWDQLPEHGSYFLKDCSQLKLFSGVITADYFITPELFEHKSRGKYDSTLILPKDHIYQVSSVFPVKAEYRVYVIQGKIENMVCYNGDCMILPDISLIKKAVALINLNEKWLRSYTIDIMVGNPGTAIIEVHNFTSVGLYATLWGNNLVQAYIDGIDYLVNDNQELVT